MSKDCWVIVIVDTDELEDILVFNDEGRAATEYLRLRGEAEEESCVIDEDNFDVAGETDQFFRTNNGYSYYFRRAWLR